MNETQHQTATAAAIEANGTDVPGLDFSTALVMLKDGHKVTRAGWNGAGQFVEIQRPDEHSKMKKPYLYLSPVDGQLVPWLASQTDLLAEDWFVLQ